MPDGPVVTTDGADNTIVVETSRRISLNGSTKGKSLAAEALADKQSHAAGRRLISEAQWVENTPRGFFAGKMVVPGGLEFQAIDYGV